LLSAAFDQAKMKVCSKNTDYVSRTYPQWTVQVSVIHCPAAGGEFQAL